MGMGVVRRRRCIVSGPENHSAVRVGAVVAKAFARGHIERPSTR
jgi:hypothetical protein